MIAQWSDNFLAILDKLTAVILQPPFIYFLGITVLLVVIKLFKEVLT